MKIRLEKIMEAVEECSSLFKKFEELELTMDEVELLIRSMNQAIEKMTGNEQE